MKKTKKILAMACAMALSAAIAVGGTLAYLTDKTTEVKNTFTVGNVTITLDEAKVDVYGVVDTTAIARVTENTYKLIPGHTYTKDPTVHVDANSEDSWLFVKVVNGISAIEATGNTTIDNQMTANGTWTLVEGTTNVYAYKETVSAGDDVVVFSNFTLANDADVANEEADYASANITIQAYAVQADGFGTAAAAWAAAPASWN